MVQTNQLKLALLFCRVSILLVLAVWTLDKFVNPEHAAVIFEKFYAMSGLSTAVVTVIALAELFLLVAFFLGIKKTLSYGAVLVIHAASTLAALANYFAPFEGSNLLFFAAWPMLAACLLLFLLREQDTMLQLGGAAKSSDV